MRPSPAKLGLGRAAQSPRQSVPGAASVKCPSRVTPQGDEASASTCRVTHQSLQPWESVLRRMRSHSGLGEGTRPTSPGRYPSIEVAPPPQRTVVMPTVRSPGGGDALAEGRTNSPSRLGSSIRSTSPQLSASLPGQLPQSYAGSAGSARAASPGRHQRSVSASAPPDGTPPAPVGSGPLCTFTPRAMTSTTPSKGKGGHFGAPPSHRRAANFVPGSPGAPSPLQDSTAQHRAESTPLRYPTPSNGQRSQTPVLTHSQRGSQRSPSPQPACVAGCVVGPSRQPSSSLLSVAEMMYMMVSTSQAPSAGADSQEGGACAEAWLAPERRKMRRMALGLCEPSTASLADQCEFISLGCYCAVSRSLQALGLKKLSYPFDWTRSSMAGVIDLVQDEFEDFFEYSLEEDKGPLGHVYGDTSWDGSFWHHDIHSAKVRADFTRRIDRFLGLREVPDTQARVFVRAVNSTSELSDTLRLRKASHACLKRLVIVGRCCSQRTRTARNAPLQAAPKSPLLKLGITRSIHEGTCTLALRASHSFVCRTARHCQLSHEGEMEAEL